MTQRINLFSFPPTIWSFFCSFLLIVIIFQLNYEDSSTTMKSSVVVFAFQISSSFQSSSQTRIRSDLNYENNNNDIIDRKTDVHQYYPRRRFFKQAVMKNSILLVGVMVTTTAAQTTTLSIMPANAIALDYKDTKNAVVAASTEAGVSVSKKSSGLAQLIRGAANKMDELQRDLMQERWDLLKPYPAQLRSYVSIFTTYTDAAFPSDSPSDYGLRVALRYEVGRLFASVERLKRAIAKQSLEEAYTAYADMSLHLDRYLRLGGLYTNYDSAADDEILFNENSDTLVYADPVKDPAEVRDLIVLCRGPDMGKTGIVIGVYPRTEKSNNCVVKLDQYRGMREIRVVPRSWAAKRLGEQAPDAVFLIPRD